MGLIPVDRKNHTTKAFNKISEYFISHPSDSVASMAIAVDNFIDMVKNNGGVYDFKTVVDKSNNDDEVIDHNMGVIDIFIEPARAMDILVQKLTILRTGVIESGTFE